MSDFDGKVIERLKRLEREVERLQVKERPVVITDHGNLAGLEDNDHPQYLLTTAKAADADKLDGIDSTGFATSTHNHDTAYLGITATAADSSKLASKTPGATGLDLVQATNVTDARSAIGMQYSELPSLTDDKATNIVPKSNNGFLIIRALAINTGALISFAAVTGTAYCSIIASSGSIEARTGALSGTTGTDGKLTVSAHTDGKIYLENRLGYTIYLAYICL
jgi:hypothetical protein